jgi:hypothetical protein
MGLSQVFKEGKDQKAQGRIGKMRVRGELRSSDMGQFDHDRAMAQRRVFRKMESRFCMDRSAMRSIGNRPLT